MGGSATGGQRILREHIPHHVDNFLLSTGLQDVPYYITGSYRRGKPDSGDIELVFVCNNDQTLAECQRKIARVFGYCQNLNARMQGLWGTVQFDLFIASDITLGSMLLHTTGNGMFNIVMRKKAQMFGLLLNQYGLWRGNERIIGGKSEENYFKYLSMDYIKPEDRSI